MRRITRSRSSTASHRLWNRDVAAALNLRHILDGLRSDGATPIRFQRQQNQSTDEEYPRKLSLFEEGALQLSKDIELFANCYLYQSPKERDRRRSFFKQLCALQAASLPQFKIALFGSEGSGLHLRGSDMDFVLVPFQKKSGRSKMTASKSTSRRDSKVALRGVAKMLREKGLTKSQNFVWQAPVPLLQCTVEGDPPLSLDFTYLHEDGHLTTAFIRDEMQLEPILRPLIALIRNVTRSWNLGNASHGGLGSYGAGVMMAWYVQYWKARHHMEGEKVDASRMGEIFLGFLHFFSLHLSYETHCIGFHDGKAVVYSKSDSAIADLPFLAATKCPFVVLDPVLPEQNVTRLTKIAKESLEASQKFPLAKQYEKRDRTYLQAQKRDEMDGDCVEPGSLRDKLFESMGLSPRPLPSPRIRKRGMKARAKNQAVPIYQTSTKGSGDEV
ncbi:MAG: hypothetical protein DHS80DRAFT_33285 [Piptocephalis tieghemiana]|nr:MAG: hypothetical protein DHS80DRAFT_33285 [Piptocephalis tieghemiana]